VTVDEAEHREPDGDRAYVDRRVLDLGAAGRVAEAAAKQWLLTSPSLLRHGMNAIFRSDDVVLRVSTPTAPAELSIELAGVLADAGIPVARPARTDVVHVDDFSVTAWDHVPSSGEPVDWRAVGAVVRRVHALQPSDVPAGLPTPSPAAFPWWNFDQLLADVADHIDDDAMAGLTTSIEQGRGWSDFDETVVCHGDVHPGNVIMTSGGPVLIDWDLLCLAPPGWDHAPLLTWAHPWGGDPHLYEAFAAGAEWSAHGHGPTEMMARLRLVAATLMRVKVGMADESAMPEAQRRLAFWRADPDAPVWRAT